MDKIAIKIKDTAASNQLKTERQLHLGYIISLNTRIMAINTLF